MCRGEIKIIFSFSTIKLCFVINVLKNKTIILLNLGGSWKNESELSIKSELTTFRCFRNITVKLKKIKQQQLQASGFNMQILSTGCFKACAVVSSIRITLRGWNQIAYILILQTNKHGDFLVFSRAWRSLHLTRVLIR